MGWGMGMGMGMGSPAQQRMQPTPLYAPNASRRPPPQLLGTGGNVNPRFSPSYIPYASDPTRALPGAITSSSFNAPTNTSPARRQRSGGGSASPPPSANTLNPLVYNEDSVRRGFAPTFSSSSNSSLPPFNPQQQQQQQPFAPPGYPVRRPEGFFNDSRRSNPWEE
jgi:hypothetical protein